EGSTDYEMETLLYNFNSRKARITNMTTKQQDGTLQGAKLKKMPDNSFNIKNGKYTVCDAPNPHYYLKMTTVKVMTEPTQQTVFGPAYVVVEDVPLPIGVPFGFVPKMPDRASGVLIPTYGEEKSRGLYIKGLGYYFVFGNYFDLSVTGDYYTLGSWAVNLTSRYKVKYKFDGSFTLKYSVDQTGERDSPDFYQTKNFGVTWSHSQDSKANPGTSFKASVNFSSPSNSRYNSTSVSQGLQNQSSSSISYSKTFTGGSISVNALHTQNSTDSSYSITFPNVTLTLNRFYPFKRKQSVGSEKFWEKISLSYNTTLQNKISFTTAELDTMNFLSKLQNGMTHNFSIGLPSFTLLNYINVSPSVSYGMNWYFREMTKSYDEKSNSVITSYSDQFSHFGVSQTFSSGVSMSTRIYGLFQFGNRTKLQAIRHMITPSLSISYKPELGTPLNGFKTLTYTDNNGKEQTVEYNKYSGNLYSPPGKGRTAALSFSVGNNLEAKVRNPSDTTGKGTKKVKLLDQLNFSGSYNFLADSLRLSNISVSASTTIFGKMALSGNMTLNPYAVNYRGTPINKLQILEPGNFKIARLTNASASLSYSLNGKGEIKGNDGHGTNGGSSSGKGSSSDYVRVYENPMTGEYIPGGWVYYLNPSIPWSLSFSLNYSFSRSYQYANETLVTKNSNVETMSVSGQVHLTPRMNLNLNTGFDLAKMKMTTTQLSATYDLHCFNISVSWVPSGKWASWSFRIAANAASLSDILQYKKSSSYWDN
ncbi:MAG: LPS-assembly protein LptD, partial [Bacteroidales bacterium]|nr:LPS-assembly protein LptD [Bacteroidales bacterium]